MKNEIILSQRTGIKDILLGKIDYLIRISDKNRWTKNSVFIIKPSFISTLSDEAEIIILSSELIKVQEIPIEILSRCGYKSQSDFKEQWEYWFQKWDAFSTAWLIHFSIKNDKEFKPIEFDEDIFL